MIKPKHVSVYLQGNKHEIQSPTFMKLKKILCALLITPKILAFIWIAISLAVVAIGAIVVVRLVQTIRHVIPDNPPNQTNNVTRVFVDDKLAYSTFGTNDPAWNAQDDDELKSCKFSIQYGLKNEPWIKCGSNLNCCLIGELEGTINNYTFTMIANGQKIQIYFDVNFGFYSQVIDSDPNLYSVIIERSQDLLNWIPVFTNEACLRWTVENWTDTNAPVDSAFYRIKY